MIKYVMPKKLLIEEEREEGDYYYGRFSLAPLEKGFSTTIGNSLRRVLLSSIMSLAITKIKIPEKFHEYDTIDGVKEDILEIIMNVKQIQLRKEVKLEGEVELVINKTGPGVVTAGDIKCPAGIVVTNPDHVIATLNEDANFEMFMYAEMGKGYVPIAEFDEIDDIQMIPIDGIFSPVMRVNFRDEDVRVGKKTDFDKLILEVWTKKNITPREALRASSNILIGHFTKIQENLPELTTVEMIFETPSKNDNGESDEVDVIMNNEVILEEVARNEIVEEIEDVKETVSGESEVAESSENGEDIASLPIERLDLTVRALNCLKRDKVNTIGELMNRPIQELLKIRNFGRMSLEEVNNKLKEKFDISLDL
ncbi:MAG TPA: DNA-directed RNA polymerase subunit alpha [Thermotogota bacterium]|nr:DNA-directed RNA polymerase subunit alpha [Thermotogota bacterium]HPJ88152.1 DNA-directed RNA polymerase subunit alpha [Thermotogota bacterium]HPR95585.1 DNA-directed RNA polymerase subunit alpha [Thermotogota bacterium]